MIANGVLDKDHFDVMPTKGKEKSP
jgi:hypothetical protein